METLSDKLGKELLEKIGFNVLKIPETNLKKEADFICSYKNITILIECKLKIDDKEVVEKKDAELFSKGISIVEGKEGYILKYKSIIRNASKQMKSSSITREFNFLLFISTGINSMLKTQNIKSTLYGSINLFRPRKDKISNELLTCYNYTFSEFKNYNNIDACLIITEAELNKNTFMFELCLNHFSEKFGILSSSNVLELFPKVINPIQEELDGFAYIVDDNINKKLSDFHKISPMYNPIICHLKEKYNMEQMELLIPLNFNRPEITVINK
ncbi:hypothetical protein [Aliarcobacter butzleri]|uniref:hypothetical protein n=1 Tax=Aliarcobacter butzleri TaxID=28197 RepID=UPI0021B2BC56|nr:hypothetical protein [Aliarcobacter butzleri]MCT7598997.1 hypothetical protein [Aliarcobacter butzleri]MCT7632168.1 hypothetical protein [Aliarcobacter butzleri]